MHCMSVGSCHSLYLRSGMTLLVRVIMPLTEMSLLMSLGLRSRMTFVSRRL